MDSPSAPPTALPSSFEELPRRAFVLTIAGLMLGMLLAALDQTIVGTAMPRVVAELGGFDQYSWVITAYLVASTVTVPIVGKLSDLHGRKVYYLLGIVVFLIGSALCGAANDMTQLIVFRGVQGLGAGVMQAIAFTVIADLFPPAKRGRAQGMFAAVFGLASILGPTTGGYITDNLSWRWVFYVNLPLGLLALGVLALFFPSIKPNRPHRGIDYVGAATLTLAVVPFLLALTWGGSQYPWGSPEIVGLFVVAIAFAVIFVWNETRVPEPIIPLSLFRNDVLTVSIIVTFLSTIGMFGSILFIPLFIQGVIGGSATASGNVLTPMMISFIVGAVISGQIVQRTGRYKRNAVLGIGLMTIGLGLLSTMSTDTDYATAIAFMVLIGIGLGSTMPVFTIAAQNAVDYRELGVATSVLQFARSMGGAIGAAVLGTMVTNTFATRLKQNLASALPPEVLQNLPPPLLRALENPRALFGGQDGAASAAGGPEALAAALGPQGQQIAGAVVQAMRSSLADAIALAFLVAAIVGAVTFVATLFLRELPLRKSNRDDVEQAGVTLAAEAPPAAVLPADDEPRAVPPRRG